jgi:RimJ/RimL family protein N-acetyltransferase
MQLVLKSCTIRPWRLDDAESLATHLNNRKVWLALGDRPHPYSLDDAHEFLQQAVSEQPTTKFCIAVEGVARSKTESFSIRCSMRERVRNLTSLCPR